MIGKLTMLDGTTAHLSLDDLSSFRNCLNGTLLTPDHPAYNETRQVWNAMIDRHPGLIVRCTGTADVVQAVRFARRHRLLTSVRGGGHNIAGLAVCEGGLMIDLSLLRGIWVDPVRRTARAQAGCTLGDVDRETQLHGLATVMGFISATGIAGLTVGGGFGYLTRRHGWTCDNVASMEVVTAEGKVLHASGEDNADLFWALRGGGGNFGIVTSFQYRLFPVGPEVLGGAIAWRGEDARNVVDAFREFTATAPRELASVVVLRIAPPAPWLPKEIHGKPIAAIFLCHTGRIEDGEKLVAPLRKLGTPVADIVTRRPYTQMQTLLDATQPKGRRYYWKSHYLAEVGREMSALAAEHAARIESPHSAVVLFHIGGALNELSPEYSPVGNRDASYVVNITASWENPDEDAAHIGWARSCFEAMRPWGTGGTYLNFLTAEEGADRIAAAYGPANLKRLSALKRKWDPEDLFRHTKPVT